MILDGDHTIIRMPSFCVAAGPRTLNTGPVPLLNMRFVGIIMLLHTEPICDIVAFSLVSGSFHYAMYCLDAEFSIERIKVIFWSFHHVVVFLSIFSIAFAKSVTITIHVF